MADDGRVQDAGQERDETAGLPRHLAPSSLDDLKGPAAGKVKLPLDGLLIAVRI